MNKSDESTIKHIRRVQELLGEVVMKLLHRARIHDRTKLEEPEAATFAECTERLSGLTYGSDEYHQCLADMKPALDHHYANNRHHPEHFKDGIAGMTLLDLLEMVVDWKAATERHADGNIKKSLEINKARFGIDNQLQSVLENTVRELFPLRPEPWHCFGCGAGGCTHNFCYQCGAGRKDYDQSN